jgi:hypothetical protein
VPGDGPRGDPAATRQDAGLAAPPPKLALSGPGFVGTLPPLGGLTRVTPDPSSRNPHFVSATAARPEPPAVEVADDGGFALIDRPVAGCPWG